MLLKHHQKATVPPVVVSGARACETVPQVAAAKGFNTLLVAAKVREGGGSRVQHGAGVSERHAKQSLCGAATLDGSATTTT